MAFGSNETPQTDRETVSTPPSGEELRPATALAAPPPAEEDDQVRPAPCRCEEVVDPQEWQQIADACSWATFFHTPSWLRPFTRMDSASRIATLLLRFEDGTRAVFPSIERRRFAGTCRSAQSTSGCCYGGWIADRDLSVEQRAAVLRAILGRSCNLLWRVNPIDPAASSLSRRAAIRDTTEILRLDEFGDDEELRHHFRHSARKQINKGCRAGLAAWVADTWSEWEAYYRIYEARLHQWGKRASSRYPLALFREFFEERGPAVRLWVVGREGKILGGNLNFYHGRHCVEWHAAYDCDFFHCGVRDFLVDTIVRDARARGFLYYDFNPSGGHEGTRRFKQTFGTKTYPSDLIVVRRGLYRAEAARRLIHKLRSLRRR